MRMRLSPVWARTEALSAPRMPTADYTPDAKRPSSANPAAQPQLRRETPVVLAALLTKGRSLPRKNRPRNKLGNLERVAALLRHSRESGNPGPLRRSGYPLIMPGAGLNARFRGGDHR